MRFLAHAFCALLLFAVIGKVTAKTLESASDVASLFRDECLPFSFVDQGNKTTPARFAVILSGSSRTFHEAWPSLHRLLLEQNDVDVFASINLPVTAKKFDCWQFVSLIATGKVRSLVAHKTGTDDVVALASETSNPSFPYTERQQENVLYNSNYFRGILLQHYWNSDAYVAMQAHESKRKAQPYNLVVRVRPDVVYLNDDLASIDLDALHTYANREFGDKYSYVPDSNNWGGITDTFAIVSRPCSNRYFRILHDMEHYLTKEQLPFHSETLTRHALVTKGGCKIILLEEVLQTFHGGSSPRRIQFDYCIARKGRCDMRPAPLPPVTCAYPSEHGDWDGWNLGA